MDIFVCFLLTYEIRRGVMQVPTPLKHIIESEEPAPPITPRHVVAPPPPPLPNEQQLKMVIGTPPDLPSSMHVTQESIPMMPTYDDDQDGWQVDTIEEPTLHSMHNGAAHHNIHSSDATGSKMHSNGATVMPDERRSSSSPPLIATVIPKSALFPSLVCLCVCLHLTLQNPPPLTKTRNSMDVDVPDVPMTLPAHGLTDAPKPRSRSINTPKLTIPVCLTHTVHLLHGQPFHRSSSMTSMADYLDESAPSSPRSTVCCKYWSSSH